MKVLKKSQRQTPKVSLILLDWGVRESFHLLHYLKKQTVGRDAFEVILVEYYSGISAAAKKFEEEIDSWILLEMPSSSYYHKHVMYNVGIILAQGEIVVICDSDAMAKPTFIESILKEFQTHDNIFLHLDQFRNHRKDLYPFCYPTFEEVTGPGCINYQEGKTVGVCADEDVLHRRNYGACFCAKREDLLLIGGADEHIDYVGHMCGPYELSFRLINLGKKEKWHQSEFLYHTWHPGEAGVANYCGPHDGRHMSSTALTHLIARETLPHVMNPSIAKLMSKHNSPQELLLEESLSSDLKKITQLDFLTSLAGKKLAESSYQYLIYAGHYVNYQDQQYHATPLAQKLALQRQSLPINPQISHATLTELRKAIRKKSKLSLTMMILSVSNLLLFFGLFLTFWKLFKCVAHKFKKTIQRMASKISIRLIQIAQKFSNCHTTSKYRCYFEPMILNAKNTKSPVTIIFVNSRTEKFFVRFFCNVLDLNRVKVKIASTTSEIEKQLLEIQQYKEEYSLFIPENIYILHFETLQKAGVISLSTVI